MKRWLWKLQDWVGYAFLVKPNDLVEHWIYYTLDTHHMGLCYDEAGTVPFIANEYDENGVSVL